MAHKAGDVLALIVVVLLAGCVAAPPVPTTASSPLSPLPSVAPTPGPLALTLIHSNDTWGYVDPCG